jgi:hypothetical protein
MERIRQLQESFEIAQQRAERRRHEKDVQTLTDLELVLVAGGEEIICWDTPK